MTRKATRVRRAKTKRQKHFEQWIETLSDPRVQIDIKESIRELEALLGTPAKPDKEGLV